MVSENEVAATGGTIGGEVLGAQGSGTVSGNKVTLNGSVAGSMVAGGLSTGGDVSGNVVSVTGGSVTGDIYGGFSQAGGSATGNRVVLDHVVKRHDDAGGLVIGGLSLEGSASGNAVTIDGGRIGGDIVGGYAAGGSGDATGNTVIVRGNADISESVIYGGKSDAGSGDVWTGNTLQIWTYGQVARNVANFENYQFIVTPSMQRSRDAAGKALLTLTDGNPTDLSNSKISIAVAAGAPLLQVGNDVTLIRNDAGIDTTGAIQTEMTGVQGVSLDYKMDLNLDNSTGDLSAVVKEAPVVKASTSVFSTGRLATMGFLNQANDLALGDGLNRAILATHKGGAGFYGAVSAGDIRYDTGSGSRSTAKGENLLAGVAAKLDNAPDRDVIGSAYVEAGWGDIDDHTSQARGDGNTHYYGFGLMAKVRQNEGTYAGAYGQVNAKAGRVNTDFKSDLVSAEGVRGAYDRTATYYGAGLGAGYLTTLSGQMSLDVSAAYQWMHINGYDAQIANDPYHFDDIDSHRTTLGARLNFTGNERVVPYVGLAWEHEFSGTARGTVYGLNLDDMSMKGDSGVGEIGLNFKPGAKSAWTIDAAVKGYVGEREGVQGRVIVNYAF